LLTETGYRERVTSSETITTVNVSRDLLSDLKQLQLDAERAERRRVPLAEIIGRLVAEHRAADKGGKMTEDSRA
jgi:hypothetical protein